MENGDHTIRGNLRVYAFWMYFAMAAAIMGTIKLAAQDWQTVDDFSLGSGNAEAHGVAVDAAGRIYVVGTANGHGIVRSSVDGGTSWSTLDDFVYPSETNSPSKTNNSFTAITINHQGDLFVGGAGAASVGGVTSGHWIVRRSTDHGVSWETVDDYSRPMIDPSHPGTNGAVYSLSSDGQGRVFGAGLMLETGPSYLRWWVRGSDIGGTNWDTKLVLFSGYAGVSQLTWAGEDVYVTGAASDSELTTGLIVKSSDFGATWSTNFLATNENYPAITSVPAGNIYAAGIGSTSNSNDWLVRKATPGGTNWTILDRFSYSGSPNSIAVDATGNICVAGRSLYYNIYTDNGGTHYDSNWAWVSRQYSVASGQWNTTDVFSYSPNPTNTHATAMGTAIAHGGSTFVVGYGSTESGQRRWVVRKRAAAHPPQLQIAVANGSVTVSWPGADANSVLEWTDSADVNQLWQVCPETVRKVEGQNAVTCELTAGARFFRLKTTAGQ